MELESLIERGETEEVEFKESLKLKDEIGQAISSFSNTGLGKILVGVKDSGKVIGVDLGENTLEKLANYIKRNTDPSIYPSLSTEKISGEDIVLINVEESSEKPVFFKDKAYKRVGNADHKLKSSEIRKLAKDSGEKVYWDEQVCEEASLEDIDKEKVEWFLKKAKHERDLDVDPKASLKEVLTRLELIKNGNLKNAAVLLFGKNPQKFFLQAETKCARFKGTEPLEFIDMKSFGGNIIDQREDALEFVKEHIKLHAKIVGTEREERWEYPIEAVREAITNAICHRNYQTTSKVQVRIFDDRIEVWGCGPLPKPLTVEDLKKEHKSILRNPLIGKCFFLIKYIEEWGTGTNRMVDHCVEHGLPEPVFEITSGSLVITLRKEISEELLRGKDLNDRQIKAVDYLKENDRIKRKTYCNIYEVGKTLAYEELNEMVEKGIIKRRGKGRGTYYVLKTKRTINGRLTDDSQKKGENV